jgi:hypothetical protein
VATKVGLHHEIDISILDLQQLVDKIPYQLPMDIQRYKYSEQKIKILYLLRFY